MKNISFLFIVFIFANSCQKDKRFVQQANLIANENISDILESFVENDTSNKLIYELYINKKTPDIYELILYKGKGSLVNRVGYKFESPVLLYKTKNGITFNIYSGIEHYFRSKSISKSVTLDKWLADTLVVVDKDEYKIEILKDSANIITKENVTFAYPFMPLPTGEVIFDH